MKSVILSLGSNMADRRSLIERAGRELSQRVGNIVRASSMRESESWGFQSTPFLNQVLEVLTDLSPEQLLDTTQQIERDLGRTEKSGRDAQGRPVYHDRPIDIDLLWVEDERREGEKLTLPHPGIPQRAFVLVLLAELYGDTVLEPFECSFQQMLDDLSTKENQKL